MNVRIQYDVEFLGAAYIDQGLQINNYTASMSLITGTSDKIELNVAMERLKCFVYGILSNTVFMHQVQADQAELLTLMGMNITTLPQEPVDQIIGMMLYCKLNAIMEGRLTVTSVDITSTASDGVWYLHNEEESVGLFNQPGWWNHSGTLNHNIEFDDENNKIVKVPSDSWSDYDLSWPDDKDPPTGNIVVYANFGKNEDNSIQ
jgi:hypothetical protein